MSDCLRMKESTVNVETSSARRKPDDLGLPPVQRRQHRESPAARAGSADHGAIAHGVVDERHGVVLEVRQEHPPRFTGGGGEAIVADDAHDGPVPEDVQARLSVRAALGEMRHLVGRVVVDHPALGTPARSSPGAPR